MQADLKLTVIDGKTPAKQPVVIPQIKLYEVMEIRRQLEWYQRELDKRMFEIKADLRAGAQIEPGLLRVNFVTEMVVG